MNRCDKEDDIDLLALEIIEQDEDWVEHERTIVAEAGVMPQGVGLKGNKSGKFRRSNQSPLEQLCIYVKSKSKGKRPFIVFENMEHCLDNSDVVTCLRSLVLRIDDEMTARSKVQLCFVGVPSDIKSVLAANNRYQTIANRIAEVPEVRRMTKEESRQVIYHGFAIELQMSVDSSFEYCVGMIQHLSYRIPQYIHDICLQISFAAEDQNRAEINPEVVESGASRWMDTNARQSRESIEKALGFKTEHSDLRAFVLYSVACLDEVMFSSESVRIKLIEQFPEFCSTRKVLAITRVLNGFCSGEERLLKLDTETNRYRVVTPKLRSVLRHYLVKTTQRETITFREASAS